MALVRWDPTRELDGLQADMNRLFDAFFQGRDRRGANGGALRRWVPPMDLSEAGDDLLLRVDLPGLDRDDVSIEIKDGVLTVSGERQAEHKERDEGFYRVERAFGSFSRSLDLPGGIDPGDVKAEFDKGVLEVRIPKPQESRATQVEIGSGSELTAGAGSNAGK